MIGITGILIALIALTIVLAAVFLVRPSFTVGTAGKVLAFVALCILPALCITTGMSTQMQRSESVKFCTTCHAMENYGKSLYIDDPKYVPAQHFQNHRVPADTACYACHADYSLYGPMKDKLRGLSRIYFQYVTAPPKTIHIDGGYSSQQCLRCHAGARSFAENPVHLALMDQLKSNQLSCISSGCHDSVHNAAEVDRQKMWSLAQ